MLFILNVMHPCVETDSHKNCRKNTNMHALVKKSLAFHVLVRIL